MLTPTTRPLKFLVCTVLVGVASGIGGMALALLLHFVQHLAYAYSLGHLVNYETFLRGVQAASPQRRFLSLCVCGLVAGIGWWLLARFGKPLVSIEDAVNAPHPRMPILTTVTHDILQIVTVALGSPLGREVAPREISALFACWLSQKTGLNASETKTLIACGAGAGLAAVYNVPISGALFALEILLISFKWSAVLPAILTSSIAVVISWIGLGNVTQYQIPPLTINTSLVIWSIVCAPIFSMAAGWFKRTTTLASKRAPHGWPLLIFNPLNFFVIGLLAIYFPQLLGNGKVPAQIEFNQDIGLPLSMTLLVLRYAIVWTSIRVGAHGGILTPSLANGAILGAVLGGLIHLVDPSFSINAFALIGATAFLATAQKMPLTAIMLILEFTHVNLTFLTPILFAVGGAVWIEYLRKDKVKLHDK